MLPDFGNNQNLPMIFSAPEIKIRPKLAKAGPFPKRAGFFYSHAIAPKPLTLRNGIMFKKAV
jgi:hypothetical protein